MSTGEDLLNMIDEAVEGGMKSARLGREEPTEQPPAEVEPQAPAVTEFGEARERLSRLTPLKPDGSDQIPEMTGEPSLGTSIIWNMQDYGVTGNLIRWAQQGLDQEDPEDAATIAAARDELMAGVSEEYEGYILGQPNMEAAEREADYIRQQAFRNSYRANEGIGQAITSGVAGFVLDPVNFVPGALVVKGMSMSAKLGTAAGLAGGKTTVAKQAATWAAAGFGEEAVRLAPKLASDPTYSTEQYLLDAGLGLAFGAAMPAAGSAFRAAMRGAKDKTLAYAAQIDEAAHAYGVDTAARTAANTAEAVAKHVTDTNGGSFRERFRSLDVGAKAREAKAKAKETISDKMRELTKRSEAQTIAKAVDEGNVQNVAKSATDYLEQVIRAVTARTSKDMADAAETARQSVGAAKRQQTTAEAVGDAAADVKQTVREVVRESRQTATEARDAAIKFIDESDLSESAKQNARWAAERAHAMQQDAIDFVARSKGVEPGRTRLNNRDHTTALAGTLKGVREAVKKGYGGMTQIAQELGLSQPDMFVKYGQRSVNQALIRLGVVKQPGETWEDAFIRSMKGKSHIQRQQAMQEFEDSIQHDLTGMYEHLDTLDLDRDPLERMLLQLMETEEAMNQAVHHAVMLAENPFEDALVVQAKWADISDSWKKDVNSDAIREQYIQSKSQSALRWQFGSLTNSMASRMLGSGSPLAGWFAMNILEVPAGFGGAMTRSTDTAAIRAEILDAQARIDVLKGWEEFMQEAADAEGWPLLRRMYNKQGNAATHEDVKRLSREVLLEINARQHGVSVNSSPHVKKFADRITKGYADLHDLQNGKVEGIHGGNKIDNYVTQQWDNARIMRILETENGTKHLEDLFRQGYMNAGMAMDEAALVAKHVIAGKKAATTKPKGHRRLGEEDADDLMLSLMELRARLMKDGVPEAKIDEIISKIDTPAGGSTPDYAKHRIPIDLNARGVIDGESLSLVDLMDLDLPAVYTKYSKEATARVAIHDATDGAIKSTKDMRELIEAMSEEARSLGTTVDTKAVENAFRVLMGKRLEYALPANARRIRDAVALAGMGGLGESQLAEFGLAITRGMAGAVGLLQRSSASRGRFRKLRKLEVTPEQAADAKYMAELQEVAGLFSEMYLVERRNVHFDALDSNTSALSKIVDTATGGKHRPLLQHLQTRFTGYGAIRQFEDQVAMASLMQDIARGYRGDKMFSSPERLRDLGVPKGDDSWLKKMFDEKVEYKPDGTIRSLNIQQWSARDRDRLGVILNRYASQQVQKSFVGEMSPEMMNPWVAFMMQFKSYQLLAAEKQQARHLKFADKEAAVTVVLNAVSSAASRSIRYQSAAAAIADEKERERYLERKYSNIHYDTFAYMGIAGMTPIVGELAGGAMSGRMDVADQIPVLNYIDNYSNAVTGPINDAPADRDVRNMQLATPMGTTAFGNILYRLLNEAVGAGEEETE